MTDGATGNAVMVDGVPITGPRRRWRSSPARWRASPICATSSRRNTARNSTRSPAASSAPSPRAIRRGGTGRRCPGCSPSPARRACRHSETTGLASEIEVNAAVDPSQGGDVNLLRDGGINARPLRLRLQLDRRRVLHRPHRRDDHATTSTQTFIAAAGLGTSDGSHRLRQCFGELAAKPASAGQQSARLPELPGQPGDDRRFNATGVNLDTEMTNMLTIENSYTTTAKLLTTVNAMFTSLLNAV